MRDVSLSAYQDVERQVAQDEGRRGLYVHAVITVIVSVGLVVLNVTVASEFPWSIFPVLGMGIGLFAHWRFGVLHLDEELRRHQRDIEHRAAA